MLETCTIPTDREGIFVKHAKVLHTFHSSGHALKLNERTELLQAVNAPIVNLEEHRTFVQLLAPASSSSIVSSIFSLSLSTVASIFFSDASFFSTLDLTNVRLSRRLPDCNVRVNHVDNLRVDFLLHSLLLFFKLSSLVPEAAHIVCSKVEGRSRLAEESKKATT